jgi:predicted nucleotidyltransferase
MFEELLSRISRTLDRHSLPYMIIGGQAVLLHGEPRLTRDIDVTLGVDTSRLGGLLDAVREAAFRPLPEDIPRFVRNTMVLPVVDEESGVRVDFIFSFTPYEQEAIARAGTVAIGGQGVRFASAEDVIIHKIFAGRPRDLEDVRSILLRNPEIDSRYVTDWLKQFDASREEAVGKGFVETFNELIRGIG